MLPCLPPPCNAAATKATPRSSEQGRLDACFSQTHALLPARPPHRVHFPLPCPPSIHRCGAEPLKLRLVGTGATATKGRLEIQMNGTVRVNGLQWRGRPVLAVQPPECCLQPRPVLHILRCSLTPLPLPLACAAVGHRVVSPPSMGHIGGT